MEYGDRMTLKRTQKVKRKLKKIHTKEKFKKRKCAFVTPKGKGCHRNAVWQSTLCKRHGGTKYDPALTIPGADVTDLVVSGITKFKPDKHPIQFLQLAREGMSNVEIAANFNISIKTLDRWAEVYQDFQVAFEIGAALHEAWWLEKGKDGLEKRSFNTALYKFLTSNKLGYSEKSENTNFNTNRVIHGVLVVPKKMSESEWEVSVEEKNPADA